MNHLSNLNEIYRYESLDVFRSELMLSHIFTQMQVVSVSE